ncbi:MAG: YraN family protein [Thermoguttaceae bacterium]|nr:YraN family protein [Thermoguttaceae bacterium]MDW8038949.1 YraN family protein [Thermoguttaceae bacterium]
MDLCGWWQRLYAWQQRATAWFRRWKDRSQAEKPLGQRGEEAAARFLRRRGYRILAQGCRAGWGELDLVALDGRTIVFVEVKTRHSGQPIPPEEAVDWKKQRRLIRAAQNFLHFHGLEDYPCRFDVVAVTWLGNQRRPQIKHFPAAFQEETP